MCKRIGCNGCNANDASRTGTRAVRQNIDVICNPWAEPLYRFPSEYDYRIVSGGRGSSKTHEFTNALIVLGHMMPLRICVAREHLKSLDESAKPELEERIREMGLMRRIAIPRNEHVH